MGFSYADWGRCLDTRCSVIGYCFFLGRVSVVLEVQKATNCSSFLIRSRVPCSCLCHLRTEWLHYLLVICMSLVPSNLLYIVTANPVFHECTKHLDIDCHVVREKSAASLMKLLLISTRDQTAHVFTKSLHCATYHQLVSKLGMVNIYQSSICGRHEYNQNSQAAKFYLKRKFKGNAMKIMDTLTIVGSPINTVEHIEIIFYGLPNEYDPIVTSILSRTDACTIPEIEYLLMNIESRIEK
ncbi:hypothetical protein CR513_36225, partial [Mucuna pruriens]